MVLDTIFTVKNEHLERLNPEEAVEFFRELLWAEASFLGLGKNLINVPSAIYTADGGIDAEVRNVPGGKRQGIIKSGLTRYQVKTGDFNLSQDKYIDDILFQPKSKELKPRVKSCLDQKGIFVIVLFGWDNPETADDQLKKKLIDKLAVVDDGYKDASIEVWRQNNLIGFLKDFPALALRLTGRQSARFETHQQWSRQMEGSFEVGGSQQKILADIRTILRESNIPTHIRIIGEAGIGKTRLVLEATNTEDLIPLIIYSTAHNFRDSDLMTQLLRSNFSAILVLDECDYDTSSYLWNKFKYHSSDIKLITIYNEDENASGITYIELPPLAEKHISQIIQTYKIPKEQADKWARECSGSPRVAHVIGANLREYPEDIFKLPSNVNIWERYITGIDRLDKREKEQRLLVLRYLSLFKRFGYEGPVAFEAKAIASLIQQADPQLTWARFQGLIKDFRHRKILQGETTLYISPKMFHVWLWIDWWDTYGAGLSLEDFYTLLNPLPPSLLDWFFPMIEYAQGSKKATRIVRELLGDKGLFQ